MLASGSRDGTVRLWDTETGERIRGHSPGMQMRVVDGVSVVAFSPDGTTLASVGFGTGRCCCGMS